MALSSELRSLLEKAVVAARDAAEDASRAALGVLSVDTDRTSTHLDEETRRLRVALRAEARQLGGFERLVEECAYEQWHRMLFARFLAENDLLIHPEHGVPVTLAECEEIAHTRGGTDLWLVASEFASAMLPGIFRSDDPVLQLTLAPEGQQRLEEILAALPREVFTSEDGLGWVYQYWQAKKKKEVNASERKIGGADIAPVTQLFTENYMVRFLLENTLGAWWASRQPESPLVKEWEYLRFADHGKPAAGSFAGWPETIDEVTVMDPCCGSGHFLVVAFDMLRKMRMEAEGLSTAEAGDAVLRDNLFGLELDPRCTQIAAFALALQAWKTGGYRQLPVPNIACSGISAKGLLEDWKKLALGDEPLERSLERLHALFSDAEDLGSLIDPLRETDGELLAAQFEHVAPLLVRALERETTSEPAAAVFGRAAEGAARAASLLAHRYTLVTTNVPYLGRGKQAPRLMSLSERIAEDAKWDLATTFLQRLISGVVEGGAVGIVIPQAFLALQRYEDLRRRLLSYVTWNLFARLGSGAFRAVSGEVVNVGLFVLSQATPGSDASITYIDATGLAADQKGIALRDQDLGSVIQRSQLSHPGARVVFRPMTTLDYLAEFADTHQGIATSDGPRFIRTFWEVSRMGAGWYPLQSAPDITSDYRGRTDIIFWENGHGRITEVSQPGAPFRGQAAWGCRGVVVAQMASLAATRYTGERFDGSAVAIIPKDSTNLGPLWAFVSSPEFAEEVRRIDSKLRIANATLKAVPFDLERWVSKSQELEQSAARQIDPTQWLFSGSPRDASSPLQVAVARLVGYRWPRRDSEFPDYPAVDPDCLETLTDDDGIVCISSVRGERPASERLAALLVAAYGDEWSSAKEGDLLAEVGYAGKSLEQWVRHGFFEQHCQLFHQRPFVWHIWDGKRDGFSALVSYHDLDRANLEKLAYTYLGEWIRQQREAVTAGTVGSELRLAAAEELQSKLELILEGEDPHDIFVRWKPLHEQPLGWEPDLNDGVRLNIRPFVTAGVLRKNPKIRWGKDRGKDPKSASWYQVFKGDRINDHHLTLADKRAAREAAERRAAAS
jgi:hypothetical protein